MSEALDSAKAVRDEQLRFAATSLHDINSFLDNPIWLGLVKDVQEAMDALQQELLMPMVTTEDALKRNVVIGKIHGMLAMSIIAETKRATSQDAFDKLTKENDNATE